MNKKIDMIKNEKKFNDKNIHFNCVKIFIWIIINSDLDGLLTQCLFIENFCFSNALESIEGYFFIIFKLILYEILDIDTEKINNNENKIIAELITNIWKKISENNKKIAEFIFKIKEKMKENFKLFK